MRLIPRSSRTHRLFAALIIIGVLLGLLAACGGTWNGPTSGGVVNPPLPTTPPDHQTGPSGSSETSSPPGTTSELKIEPTAAAHPTMAPEPAGATDTGSAPIEHSNLSGPIQTTPIPPPPAHTNQQQPPLKAGEVDDNVDFAAYTAYLRSYSGPPARSVDVFERYILTVVNDQQQAVLDAHVRLFAGQQQVFEGRTYAGGKTIVFPRALGIADQTTTLRVVVEKGNSRVEGTLSRGQDETHTFVLPDADAVSEPLQLDVLFLLDATGSMGDEIAQIQRTIASIAERIDQIEPRPRLRLGLVAYRDHGDEYVTRVYDFGKDVETFHKLLLSVEANGGGDTPEALNEGLHAAIQQVNWANDAVRLIFLVADAPPHLDYPNDFDYTQEVRVAVAKGIKIYPIAASNTDEQAEYVFRQLAQQTLAHFIFLTYQAGQESGPPGDTTTHNVDPQAFTVERLDDLVVQIIKHEIALAIGTV